LVGELAEGYTSAFHEAHLGKILFSNQPITLGKEDPSTFKTTFSFKENIYAIAYLEAPLQQYAYSSFTEGNDNASYSIQINGRQEHIPFEISKEFKSNTYWQIEIIPNPDNALHETTAFDWYEHLRQLPPGVHEVQLWLWVNGKEVAAFETPLTLNWQSGIDADWLKQNAEECSEKAVANFAEIRELPEWFAEPDISFTADELSKNRISQMYKAVVDDCAEVKQVHVHFRGAENSKDNWNIEKNEFDIPLQKRQNGIIGIVYKSTDGSCYYEEYVDITMQYEGGGKYAAPRIITVKMDRKMISCSNI